MTVEEAKEKLEDVGLEVTSEDIEQPNEEIEEGHVIKTSPAIGRSVKKGAKIQLYVSTGTDKVEIENYVGQNYYEVEAKLKAAGLDVIRETREYSETDTSVKAGIIIEQSVAAGEELEKGDSITLYVPEFYVEYPDFLGENYTEEQAQAWADQNGVKLEITYRETSDVDPGMILSQSRAAGTKVNTNVPLRITVAKAPEVTPSPSESPEDPTE